MSDTTRARRFQPSHQQDALSRRLCTFSFFRPTDTNQRVSRHGCNCPIFCHLICLPRLVRSAFQWPQLRAEPLSMKRTHSPLRNAVPQKHHYAHPQAVICILSGAGLVQSIVCTSAQHRGISLDPTVRTQSLMQTHRTFCCPAEVLPQLQVARASATRTCAILRSESTLCGLMNHKP